MKFCDMPYKRPDLSALLARCEELAAQLSAAPTPEALVALYREENHEMATTARRRSWRISITPRIRATRSGQLNKIGLMRTARRFPTLKHALQKRFCPTRTPKLWLMRLARRCCPRCKTGSRQWMNG